jgi:hypothetical protein
MKDQANHADLNLIAFYQLTWGARGELLFPQ